MRKKICNFLIIGTMLGLGVVGAKAQTGIELGGSQDAEFHFVGGDNGNVAITLGSCSGGTCTLAAGSANAWGGGALSSSGVFPNGGYTLTSSSTDPLTPVSQSNGQFSINQAAPVSFAYTSSQGGTLMGTLNLTSFKMNPGRSDGGVAMGTLSITGGSLASEFGNSANIDLTVSTGSDVASLGGSHGMVTGQVSFTSEAIPSSQAAVVPEPTTIFLVGTGLVVLGRALRRRPRVT